MLFYPPQNHSTPVTSAGARLRQPGAPESKPVSYTTVLVSAGIKVGCGGVKIQFRELGFRADRQLHWKNTRVILIMVL